MTLLKHLADDDLKMLVMNVLALRAIHLLHFVQEILGYRVAAQNFQNAVRVPRTLPSTAGRLRRVWPSATSRRMPAGIA